MIPTSSTPSRLLRRGPRAGLAAALVAAACGGGAALDDGARPVLLAPPTLANVPTAATARWIGIDPVDERVVWLAGTGGAWARSIDGGATWIEGVVPGTDSLQFRDVHAVDAWTAYLLSIGDGERSRIYKTTDGGEEWILQFVNDEPEGFFDCLAFWDPDHGLAFSDSFEGAFLVVTTDDGGATWRRVPPHRLPIPTEGEGSFAASGTCVVALGDSTAVVGTGAGARARALRTADRGRTWTEAPIPIADGTPTSGVASLAFRDRWNGAALGGEIGDPESLAPALAVTYDGGRSWVAAERPTFPGAVYGGAYVPGAPTPTLVAVGPGGMDWSTDNGRTWAPLEAQEYWSVAFGGPRVGWAVGPDGRVVRLELAIPTPTTEER